MFSSKTAICMVLATAATLACIAPTNALVHGRDDVDSVDVDSVRARRDVKAAKGAKAGKVISAKLAKAPKAPKAPKTTAAPDQQAKNAAQDVIDVAVLALVNLPLNDADKAAFIAAVTADILALNNGLTAADIDSIVLVAVSRRGRARRAAVAVKLVITFSLNTNQTEIANLVSAIGGAADPWVFTNAVTVGGQTGVWGFQAPEYTAAAGATTTDAPGTTDAAAGATTTDVPGTTAAAAAATTTDAPGTTAAAAAATTTAAPDTTTDAPDTTTAAPDTTTAAPDTTTAAPDTTTAAPDTTAACSGPC